MPPAPGVKIHTLQRTAQDADLPRFINADLRRRAGTLCAPAAARQSGTTRRASCSHRSNERSFRIRFSPCRFPLSVIRGKIHDLLFAQPARYVLHQVSVDRAAAAILLEQAQLQGKITWVLPREARIGGVVFVRV